MSSRKEYIRKFIILQGRETAFSKNDESKGHAKLEVREGKGKLTVNVEGLKHMTDVDKIYKVELLGKSSDNIIKEELGMLEVDEKGKGKTVLKFNPHKIGKKELNIEEFSNLLIELAYMDQENNEIIAPLAGYIEEDGNNIEDLIQGLSRKEIKEDYIENEQNEKEIEMDEEEPYIEKEHKVCNEMLEDANKDNEGKQDVSLLSYEAEIDEEIIEIEESDYDDEKRINDLDGEENLEEVEIEKANIEKELQRDEIGETERNKGDIKNLDEEKSLGEGNLSSDLDEGNLLDELDELDEDVEELSEIDKLKEDIAEKSEETIQENSVEEKFMKIDSNEDEYFIDENELEEQENYGGYEQEQRDDYRAREEGYGYSLNKNSEYNKRARIYSTQISNYTMNILKFFEKVEPFQEKMEGYDWWEIEYDDKNLYRGFLPYYNHIIGMYYPYPSIYKSVGCQSLIKKYNHYIFGIMKMNDEVKYYVYGMPGQYTRREQPHRGATGFTKWRKKKGNNGLGYWIIHIDPTTGRVVNPQNTDNNS
ncbi:hypothetical protein [Sporosalibacterium faouarense]|uniref:hypothetical protein n=1 Tax=Sporosalibacterium faouarense TaxID=516123 RepID=UPI00192AB832|nr:hypothetical protein [Sporosalibacterium faouarense]